MNDRSRAAGWNPWFSGWPNDTNYYELDVRNSADVNRVAAALGKIEAKTVRIRLDPGEASLVIGPDFDVVGNRVGAMFAVGKQPVIGAWLARLPEVAPGVRQFGTVRYPEPPAALPPTLTLYVRHKAIDLNKLDVPMGVEVEAAVTDEYRRRHTDDPLVKAIDRFVAVHRAWRQKGEGAKQLTEPYPTAAPARGEAKVKPAPADPQPSAPFKGHSALVYHLVFSADVKTLASAGDDKTVRVWDAGTGKELARIDKFEWGFPTGMFLSADGRTHAVTETRRNEHGGSYSREDAVRFWDARTGRRTGNPVNATALAFSPDCRTLVLRVRAPGAGWQAVLWDVGSEREGAALPEEHGKVKHFTTWTLSPDGKTVAATTADRTVVVWDAATGKKLITIAGHAVAWAIYPKAQQAQNESRLPPKLTEAELKELEAALAAANFHTAYSPDGGALATSRGGEIKLWTCGRDGKRPSSRAVRTTSRTSPSLPTGRR